MSNDIATGTRVEPGVYTNISNERYHAGPGISKSGLDLIDRCPLIYYGKKLDPERPRIEYKEKPGQLEGTLAHCAVLEPDEFEQRYVVGPDCRRGTNQWKAFEQMNPDKVIIKTGQYDAAMRQGDRVRAHPIVREAMGKGIAEASAYWVDERTGILCRCRPDWAHTASESEVILADLKTYSSADPDEFRHQAARKRYHVQDSFYTCGYSNAANVDVLAFLFVAVETEYPHAVSVIELDHQSKELGMRGWRDNLATLRHCLNTDQWDGYGDDVKTAALPRWIFQKEEESA